MKATFDNIAEELKATRLLSESRIERRDDGVVAYNVGMIAEGYLMRVAEKYNVSVCNKGDVFLFHKMPYAEACSYVSLLAS